MKIIDLSEPCADGESGVEVTPEENPPVYCGYPCAAYHLSIPSHTGTYFETPAHLFPDTPNTGEVPLEDLVLPGFCARVSVDKECISAKDLESACRALDPGSALLVDTGDDRRKIFSRDAAVWMADRGVQLMGSSTRYYDRGYENPTGFFVDLFKAGIPIVANLANLGSLPEKGFTLLVMPLRVKGVCTVPCRVAALVGALRK